MNTKDQQMYNSGMVSEIRSLSNEVDNELRILMSYLLSKK